MKALSADTMYIDSSTMYRIEKPNKGYASEKQWMKTGMQCACILSGCVRNL
jgi:hypothetical protein